MSLLNPHVYIRVCIQVSAIKKFAGAKNKIDKIGKITLVYFFNQIAKLLSFNYGKEIMYELFSVRLFSVTLLSEDMLSAMSLYAGLH